MLACCTIDISHNCLPKFPSAALSPVSDAAAPPPSSALQTENLFCAIMLKVNGTAHWLPDAGQNEQMEAELSWLYRGSRYERWRLNCYGCIVAAAMEDGEMTNNS